MAPITYSSRPGPPTGGWASLDGRLAAPGNASQYPRLYTDPLGGPPSGVSNPNAPYPVRPPWNVAGVDYGVGIHPSSFPLLDPNTYSASGVVVDTVNHVLGVTGNNVVIDGYDLTKNGGWVVQATTGSNVLVRNCKFINVSNSIVHALDFQGIGNASTYGSGYTVEYCEIDGSVSKDVNLSRSGPGLIRYCWLKNFLTNTLTGIANTVAYNILENSGTTTDITGHQDIIQTFAEGASQIAFTASNPSIAWNDQAGNAANAIFAPGDNTFFDVTSTDTLPPEFTAGLPPHLLYISATGLTATHFQVSATPGGASITPSTTGTASGHQWAAWPQKAAFYNQFKMNFNTFIQNLAYGANLGTLGCSLEGNTNQGGFFGFLATFDQCEIGNNTFICTATPKFAVGDWIKLNPKQCTAAFPVHDNYVDSTGNPNGSTGLPQLVHQVSASPDGSFNGSIVESGNINLVTGGSIL